jgi:hypothetical protein
MKRTILFLSFALFSIGVPANSQQVTTYSVCTNYQENYNPGYYDRYGNYIQGNVNSQRYNVPCGNSYQQQSGVRCSAARTTLGGLVGGGIAAAVSKKDSWSWSIPLGAVLGAGAANSNCN